MEHNSFSPTPNLEWLFFDLNSYFASVEQQDNPELRNKPIAIVPNPSDYTTIIAASYEAKAFGIKTGTKLGEAKKMCPLIIPVLTRHDVYVTYHHRIFDIVRNHLPIEKTCSIDEGACRLMGHERTAKNAIQIANNIKQDLHDKIGPAIRVSIGIAQNMFLAKTATDMQKPDGLIILPPNNYKDRLFKMKLSDLTGIGRNIEHRLNKAGIFTIEQLWNIEPRHARKIWNTVEGEKFWYKLHGYNIPDNQTKKSVIGHSRVLDPEFRQSDKAYNIIKQLTAKVAQRLRKNNLYAKKLSLSAKTINTNRQRGSHWARETSFPPSCDDHTIFQSMNRLWSTMQQDTRKSNLMKISIALYDLSEPQNVTGDLFAVADKQKFTIKNTKLSNTIDSLNKRFGSNTVTYGTISKTMAGHVGTKIAFNRVPKQEEFL